MGKQPEYDNQYIAWHNDPDWPDVDKIKKRLEEETKRQDEELDQTPPSRLGERPEFDSKAHPHLYSLSQATIKLDSGKMDELRDPENLKKFRAVKDYAASDEKHAAHVKGELDKFMERLKGHTSNNHWFQTFLKSIDEYVDTSSAPEVTEDKFHESWGADRDDIVNNINRFYGVITVDGKTTIYHILPKGKFEFLGKESFELKFCKWNVMIGERLTPIHKVWLNNNKRRDIDKLILDPRYTGNNPRIVNQWQDYPIVARQGDCSKTLAYYKDVITSGIDELYELVLDYLAHLIQKPWEKPEFAIVLVGLKGVGKTKFVQIIQRLIGELYYFQTSNPDDIYGRFKKHLMNKLVTMLEEMTWGGDKRKEGMLQDLISGRTLNIEIKHGPTITVENLLRVIIDSNSAWVVPTSHDERRFAVLKVSDAHRKDYEYFAAIDNELDNGGAEALMYVLKNRDISKFNIRRAPATIGLIEQTLEGLPELDKWWISVARLGQIRLIPSQTEKNSDKENYKWICVSRRILYDEYCKAVRKLSPRARVFSEDDFGRQLRKLVPKLDANGKVVKEPIVGKDGVTRGEKIVSLIGEKRLGKNEAGGRFWVHVMPPLSVIRELLDFRFGELDWDGCVSDWEEPEYDAM
jgi:hypothetical protein